MFIKVKDYLPNLVNSITKIELEKNSSDQQEVTTTATSKRIQLVLLHAGKHGNKTIRKMNTHKHLKDNVKVMITYQGTKLSSRFEVKDKTKFEHRNDVVYWCKCPENDCNDFYIGETARRISETIINHNKRDKNSHLLQHAQNKKHAYVWVNDFTILNSNYSFKIKVNESVYIAYLGQRHNITFNNFFLHVLNHALKRFLIAVFIDFVNCAF